MRAICLVLVMAAVCTAADVPALGGQSENRRTRTNLRLEFARLLDQRFGLARSGPAAST